MAPGLESCPDLVLELIVELLELEDVRNLRLTAKTVAEKSSHGRFRRICQSKYVDLTAEALREFVTCLQNNTLIEVKQLYLVGLASREATSRALEENEPRSQRDDEDTVALLIKAFNEIAKGSSNSCLESLTLRAAVISRDGVISLPAKPKPDINWIPKVLWSCPARAWQATLQALAASRLRVQKLNAFNDADMQRCSIPWDQVGVDCGQYPRLPESLEPVTSLSLSICNKGFYDGPEENFASISKLVELCPNLNHIELHYFRARGLGSARPSYYDTGRMLQRMVELDKLPSLKRCTLRGISATEEDLLGFITRTKPSHLSLKTIRLYKGTFTSIVRYCVGDEADIKTLLLDTLWQKNGDQGSQLVHFDRNLDHLADVQDGSERLIYRQDTFKRPVSFFIAEPIFIGSPGSAMHMKLEQLEYAER